MEAAAKFFRRLHAIGRFQLLEALPHPAGARRRVVRVSRNAVNVALIKHLARPAVSEKALLHQHRVRVHLHIHTVFLAQLTNVLEVAHRVKALHMREDDRESRIAKEPRCLAHAAVRHVAGEFHQHCPRFRQRRIVTLFEQMRAGIRIEDFAAGMQRYGQLIFAAPLLGLGEMLENYTRKKSLESLVDQLALKVDRVWVRKGETVVEVPLVEVSESDVIVVRAGSTIPVDGTVVGGEADVNQATMTGEPLPVHRTHGGQVYAGTVVEDGEIDIRPTKLAGETRLSKIIEFIETSEKSKAGIQGKAERLADAIVPYNFALAGLVFLLTRNLTRTAGVLMVDYSCALRLATPLAILAGMKTGTRNGTLIKGGRYLEALAEVDTVVFDKTGTLTAASPKLSDVVTLDAARDEKELLSLAACLEEHFPHPVSRAVVQAAVDRDLDHFIEKHDAQVNYVVAHGICSSVDSAKVIIGSRHFVEDDEGVDCSAASEHVERLAREGKSILYIACAGKLIGLLGIVDPIREESARVIAELKKRGIKRVVMLTGDDERTAAVVASKLGVDEYRAQVLPTDKAGYVQKLKEEGCKVLMVGDGINDSPALSAADVGVTLREGSAIAQEVADVVLTRNTLEDLPRAIDLGRAVMKRVRTNFVASVGLNSAFMAGGISGVLQPAMGAVLHNLTTIGVCLNAMRPADNGRIEWHDVIEKVREVLLQQPHTEHLAGLLGESFRH